MLFLVCSKLVLVGSKGLTFIVMGNVFGADLKVHEQYADTTPCV
jgi:hypothetical protein